MNNTCIAPGRAQHFHQDFYLCVSKLGNTKSDSQRLQSSCTLPLLHLRENIPSGPSLQSPVGEPTSNWKISPLASGTSTPPRTPDPMNAMGPRVILCRPQMRC